MHPANGTHFTIRSLTRSLARARSRCTCTRPTDIFRDLHHEETRNAVHLEGGLTVEVRRPMKMQIVYPLPPSPSNDSRPWTLFYGDWMSLKMRRVLTGRI